MSGEPSLNREQLLVIYRQARAEFPEECCGFVVGDEVVPCMNRQNQLHALDPQMHPRTGKDGYNIGGKELLRLTRSLDSDTPARIIYHSHPLVGAYFSEEDTRAAVGAAYPVDYLVVDVQEGEIKESKLFRQDGETFVEVERFDGARL